MKSIIKASLVSLFAVALLPAAHAALPDLSNSSIKPLQMARVPLPW